MDDLEFARTELQTELEAALRLVYAAGAEMGDPLSGLLRARLAAKPPGLYAAIVLTAGYTGPDEPAGSAPRIPLAAALELLALALDAHRELIWARNLAAAEGPAIAPADRSLIGGAILTGDYCFSRSAQLAARTGSPQVVAVFAQTLQEISEGQLRYLFGADPQPFDERRALVISGGRAALELTTLTAAAKRAVNENLAAWVLADAQATIWAARAEGPPIDVALAGDTPAQHLRRQAFAAWLSSGHAGAGAQPRPR